MIKLRTEASLTTRQKRTFKGLERISKSLALSYLGTLSGIKIIDFSLTNKVKQLSYRKDKYSDNVEATKEITNRYLKLLNNFKDPNRSHIPWDTKHGEWIGVEIECFVPNNKLSIDRSERCGECYECELDDNDEYRGECSNRNFRSAFSVIKTKIKQRNINGVSVKGDASIECDEDDYTPVEVSCVFLRTNPVSLEKLCKLLNELGAEVNKSCGLHVHLDCRDLISKETKRMLRSKCTVRGKRIAKCLNVLKTLVPESRWNGDAYNQLRMSYSERYSAVNMQAIGKYKTIEVRLHSATTSYKKIINWVNLLYDISRSKVLSKRSITPPVSVTELFQRLYADSVLTKLDELNYFKNRFEKFNEKTDAEETSGDTSAA